MYAKDMTDYIHYWKRIHLEITGPTPLTLIVLHEGFWPMTNWQRDHACSMFFAVGHDVSPNTTLEDDPEPYPYCGPAKARPKLYMPYLIIFGLSRV